MTLIKAIISGIIDGFLGWLQKQREKPKTIHDANTPPDIANRNSDAYQQWLRDQQSRRD